ncbi:hypothetical protein LNP24_15960 [Klebsiella pneumoniae subsp. pneumoniae]|nr:hypothetical protein [Klebsiella pneumoniae subsp. pneumoniae]
MAAFVTALIPDLTPAALP